MTSVNGERGDTSGSAPEGFSASPSFQPDAFFFGAWYEPLIASARASWV
jgi:hypothetical protein